MKPGLRIQAIAAAPTVVELFFYGPIGSWFDDGIRATSVAELLNAQPETVSTVRMRFNSPGGDAHEGIAIGNVIEDLATRRGWAVEADVDGLCASAATLVLMAATVRRIAANALLMVHLPMLFAGGTAEDLRRNADVLDTVLAAMVITYKRRLSLSEAEIIAMMTAETWMDAAEAVSKRFATETVGALEAAALVTDPKALAALKVPAAFRTQLEALVKPGAPTPAPAPVPTPAPVPAVAAASAVEVLALCRDANCLELATELVAESLPLADVQARVDRVSAQKKAAVTREADIRAICKIGRVNSLAAAFVAGGGSVASVREIVANVAGLLDRGIVIDTTIDPDERLPRPALTNKLDVKEIYARRNAAP